MGQQPTVCLVTAGGDHPWAIAAALADRFGEGLVVVEEEPEGKRRLIARRARSRGWANALGQLGTMAVIRIGKGLFGWRIRRTLQRKGLEIAPRPGQRIVRVPSVNSDAFIHFISDLEPDLLFLAGCRLMTAGTLRAMPCRVVNYHAGITPAYRGMNGGYWALVQGEPENFGTTVHFVDEGIDTGLVLAQGRCQPEPGDTIITYPYTMVAASLGACVRCAEEVLQGEPETLSPIGDSRLWQHPTLWTYLRVGVSKGVW